MNVTADRSPAAWHQVIPHRPPDQVAYVVADLALAVTTWAAVLGRDDWRIYTYDPSNTPDLQYRGAPSDYALRLALCGDAPQIELIQSLRGPNVYTELLDRHGPGLHHIGFFVDSLALTRAELAERGIAPVQTGSGYGLDGDGGYAYYELPGIEGFVEYIEVPRRRRPSEVLERAPSVQVR